MCSRCVWREEESDTVLTKDVNERSLEQINHPGVPVGMLGMLLKVPSLGRWGDLMQNLSERSLTHERDSTKAFAGATEIMSSTFPGGIFNGLPELLFDIALLWQPYETVSRRECENNGMEDASPS